MPWSGGVFTRDYASWTADANSSLPISASKFDQEDNGFATGLNNCLTIDGLNKPTGTLNWTVQMNWSRGSDGNVWSLARTGGSNNPKLQGSVTDASGVTLAVTGGALTQTATGAINQTATGAVALTAGTTLALSSTNFTVTTGGDTTARGIAICKFKSALTARASVTTLANDPDLAYAIPAAGTYRFEFLLPFGGTSTGTQGINLGVNYSGSFTLATSVMLFDGRVNGSAITEDQGLVAAAVTTSVKSFATISLTGNYDALRISGILIATTTGTFALSWAQNSSSVNATNLGAGAYMTVTQLS